MATVLLHPLPLDGSMWDGMLRQLDGEVLAVPSLYDLGDSMYAWATAVLDLAGPGVHTVVGNSVGASCGAEVAHLAPESVSRLVLVGGKLGHRPEPALLDEAVAVVVDEGPAAGWDRYWKPLFGPGVDPGVVAAARGRFVARPIADILCGLRVFHGREDRSDLCSRWHGRLDVVSGSLDQAPTPAVAARAAASSLHGTHHVVDGVGHYVALEAPTRLVEILAA